MANFHWESFPLKAPGEWSTCALIRGVPVLISAGDADISDGFLRKYSTRDIPANVYPIANGTESRRMAYLAALIVDQKITAPVLVWCESKEGVQAAMESLDPGLTQLTQALALMVMPHEGTS